MASTTAPKKPETKVGETETETPDPDQPDVSYMNIRGKTYRIEELENGEFEKIQRAAEIPNPKDDSEKVTDLLLQNRLLTLAAVTIVEKVGDPKGEKIAAEAWAKEKTPVVSRVNYEVRRAHYMALTDEEIAAADAKDAAANPND